MATYTKVFRTVWSDDDFKALPSAAQRLYFLLISQPDVSLCGVLPLTLARWGSLSADTDAAMIRDDLSVLIEKGFVVTDFLTEELLVRSFVKWDEGYKVPNILKAIWKDVEAIISKGLRAAVLTTLETLCGTVPETLRGRDAESQQQPAANTSSSSSNGTLPETDHTSNGAAPLTPAAAAALEIYIKHRCQIVKPHNPTGFRRTVHNETLTSHGAALRSHTSTHPDDDAPAVARAVFELTTLDLHRLGAT